MWLVPARLCQESARRGPSRRSPRISACREGTSITFSRELGSTAKRFFFFCGSKRMVRQTVMPLQEVALICGFSTYAAFSISYRRRFGLSPRMDRLERRREA